MSNLPETAAPAARTPGAARRLAPSRRARPIPASQCVGIVTEAGSSGFVVTSGDLVANARRAASCLLEPAQGDSVACLQVAPDELWILAVLRREEGVDNLLRCEGPTRIEIGSGPLVVAADRIRMQGRVLEMDVDRAELCADEAQLLGRELRVIGSVFRLVGKALDTVFDRVSHFSKHHLRTTEGIDRVQSTHIELQAEQTVQVAGKHALINGEKLVKTRGGQIHFG